MAENQDPEISFEYDGKNYIVPGDAFHKNLIKLPDGRILKVLMWIESNPPQVGEVEDVTDKFAIAREI
jgi:hypothetical protein